MWGWLLAAQVISSSSGSNNKVKKTPYKIVKVNRTYTMGQFISFLIVEVLLFIGMLFLFFQVVPNLHQLEGTNLESMVDTFKLMLYPMPIIMLVAGFIMTQQKYSDIGKTTTHLEKEYIYEEKK